MPKIRNSASLADSGTPATTRSTRKKRAGNESKERLDHISENVRIVAISSLVTSSRQRAPACIPKTTCR